MEHRHSASAPVGEASCADPAPDGGDELLLPVVAGVSGHIEPFLRTLMASPALVARIRAFEREIETELAAELRADPGFSGDSALAAALLVAAYRTVAVGSVGRRLAGDDLADIATTHCQRLNEAFDAVAHGILAGHRAAPPS